MRPQPQLSQRQLVLCIELHRTTTSYSPAEPHPRNVSIVWKTLPLLTFCEWIETTESALDANLTRQMESSFIRLCSKKTNVSGKGSCKTWETHLSFFPQFFSSLTDFCRWFNYCQFTPRPFWWLQWATLRWSLVTFTAYSTVPTFT